MGTILRVVCDAAPIAHPQAEDARRGAMGGEWEGELGMVAGIGQAAYVAMSVVAVQRVVWVGRRPCAHQPCSSGGYGCPLQCPVVPMGLG